MADVSNFQERTNTETQTVLESPAVQGQNFGSKEEVLMRRLHLSLFVNLVLLVSISIAAAVYYQNELSYFWPIKTKITDTSNKEIDPVSDQKIQVPTNNIAAENSASDSPQKINARRLEDGSLIPLQPDNDGKLSAFLLQADIQLSPVLSYETGQKIGSDGEKEYHEFEVGFAGESKTLTGVDQYEMEITTPPDGLYTLTIYPKETGEYQFWFFVYGRKGDSELFKTKENFVKGTSVSYKLEYVKSEENFKAVFTKLD